MPLYSIVVPVYNSEKSLAILHERLVKVFDEVIKAPFELILVDDCSKDSSYKVILDLISKDTRVKGVQLAVNHGQQKAVLCGMRYVSGDFVITMDDDLQHPPEEIPKLIEKLNSSDDIDVVIGTYDSKKAGIIRKFGTKLMDISSDMIFKKPKGLKLSSFRLMKRYVADNLKEVTISKPTVGPLLLQTTKRIANAEIRHDARQFGKSGYSFGQLVKTFFSNMMTNSDLPLKAVSFVGVLSFIASIALLIYLVVRYFASGISIAGWTSTISLILFFGGMILFSIGIIGKYLTNIMQEAKKMPSFLVRREDGTDAKKM
ncbi:MAG: glycosyltransferase family 2 protein [Clostridia bacterium]|nr:glycosyltransferase family 2 protein [Clostridia bacterium]